jgi:membrane associated rhomboid family serine protease
MLPIKDKNPSHRFPFITFSLIVLNSGVWIYEWLLGDLEFEKFIRTYGLVPSQVFSAPYTILTHMFLHGNLFHIISNMWVLWIFGDNVEARMGSLKYIIFYILCGLGSAFLQLLVSFIFGGKDTPMVGASGAISGILAAYMKFFPGAKIVSLMPFFFFITLVEIPAVIFIGLWFFSQVINGILFLPFAGKGGVAWWAHIGGFLVGLNIAERFARRKRRIKIRVYNRFEM